MPHKWGKLMANLANAVGAITNARGNENNRIVEAVRQKPKRSSLRLASSGHPRNNWPKSGLNSAHLPRYGYYRSSEFHMAEPGRQQGTVETDFLNGQIVRAAQQIGKQAPINAGSLGLSRMAANRERPGKYTPAQLLDLLGLS